MFGNLFNQKEEKPLSDQSAAEQLYQIALNHALSPVFYEKYGIPDDFDGRFELLLLHLFCMLHPLAGKEEYETLSQAVFDATFRNMDQTLREVGIGDMGIPKHMRRMMKAFNGRMHSYALAISPEIVAGKDIEGLVLSSMQEALRRNLYGTVSDEEIDDKNIKKMEAFILGNYDFSPEDVKQANISFTIQK